MVIPRLSVMEKSFPEPKYIRGHEYEVYVENRKAIWNLSACLDGSYGKGLLKCKGVHDGP